MRKLLFLIVLMILPLAAMADNAKTTKTLTYNFTGVSNDGLVSNNPWGGDDGVFWSAVSSYHFWSDGASAIGARCNYNDYVYTRSKETFPEVIQKVTVNAGAWSDVSTGLRLNNREVSLKTISSSAYTGVESRIQFDDYVFENVSTSDNNGHLFLEYVLSGQADIFIRSITVEYEEGGKCDMSEIPTDNDFYAATSFLCERGILDGSKDDGKYSVEEKLLRKHLANITFRGLFTLNGREIPSTFVSDQYPAIYEDLKSDASYYQAAKTLLYLDYGDGITPFDRDRDGFFPDYSESRINVLKELMEAFNIKPDTEGKNNPFPNEADIAELAETSPIRMGYVRQAAKLGIITTEHTAFHPHRECLRGEAFLMLARIIQKIEAGEIADPNPQESDFLDPNSGPVTVDPNAEPYAVLSDNNSVVTFYYDGKKAARGGMDINNSNTNYNSVSPYSSATKAVIDASFADYRPTSTAYWFMGCSSLTSVTGMEYLKTDNVTNMEYMFCNCDDLTSLDLSGFNTQNVTDMNRMFLWCSGLKSLDLSGFNTQNVTGMNNMFSNCSGLTSLDLSGFNTQNVTGMNSMFSNCSGLTSLDVTHFNTQNVTDMSAMFYFCSGLKRIDVTSFNTQNVTDMGHMFQGCARLTTIYASNDWSTAAVTDGSYMFYNCTNLKGGAGTFYDDNHTDQTYAHIDGGTANPGFFTNNNTTPVENAEPYAVLSDNNTILTFYYDENKEQNNGMGVEYIKYKYDRGREGTTSGWDQQRDNITMVVFDESFTNCTTLTRTEYWFYKLKNLTTITGISNLKTENVTSMGHMFLGCSGLTNLDVTGFITRNVTNMSHMFEFCSSLTSLDLSGFNTQNVTNMIRMFFGCSSLTTIYTGNDWSTAAVTDSDNMFYGCTNLKGDAGTVYDDNHTNHTYAHFDGGTVNPGYFTEKNAVPVENEEPYAVLNDNNTVVTFYYDDQKEVRGGVDINNSNIYNNSNSPYRSATTAVIDASFAYYRPTSTAYWFMGCSSLTGITGMENLKTDNVTSMNHMFWNCSSLTSLDVSHFNTANVTDMNHMFGYCSRLTSLDVKGFNTQNVTDMNYMFGYCSSLTSLDVTGFKTDNVTDMSDMFERCSGLTSLDVTGFKTDNVTDLSYMFYRCSGLTNLDVTGFSTEKAKRTKLMFSGCSGLTSLDVTGFKTYNVTDMYGMFSGCSGLTSLDVTGFKTDNVTDMLSMFFGCSGLTSLDVTSFKTDNVTCMNEMFKGCSRLTSLDVSGFKTDKVTQMGNMFYACSGLTTIYVGPDWSTAAVTYGDDVFKDCTNLVGGAGTTYNANHTDYTYAHIDGGVDNPGYFTQKEEPAGSCDMSEIPTDNDFYAATSFLCERGVLYGSRDDGKYSVEKELLRKHLANITFRGLFTLKGRQIPSTFVSDQYPDIYDDLKSDASYYQAAKTLLYLDYGDGITPFDRDRDGFFPDNNESRINILKELMEAFNIKPDTEGTDNPFPNDPGIAELSETSPIKMGYVRQAAKLGIITTENEHFRPYEDCLRGEAFLMLARIIQKIEAGEIADPNPQESDFLDPNSGTGTAEPYAVLSDGNTVLTFYYDNQKAARGGIDINNAYVNGDTHSKSPYGSATTAVIDASFADYRPTSTAHWFECCSSLTSISGMENIKTDNVTNMEYMFRGCQSLTSLDVTGFNTQNVTNMSLMFIDCCSLTSLDLSSFNTQNVTDMSYMFYLCSGLTSLDLSGFNTQNVTNMSEMFCICSGLKTILAGNDWSTAAVSEGGDMFLYCSKLVGSAGTTYNEKRTNQTYAHIDGGTANPGYFTAKAEGDLNGDGKVDEADVAVLVSVVMGDRNKLAGADLNHDEKVDAADIVKLVNIIMSQKKDTQQ